MSTRVELVESEIVKTRSAIQKIEEVASLEARDLTAEESAQSDELFARHEQLRDDLSKASARKVALDATASIVARSGAAVASPAGQIEVTAAEWLSLYARADKGDMQAKNMLSRTVAQNVINDVDDAAQGIVPKNLVGPVIKLSDSRRPVWNSLTSRPMPVSGKTFTRPHIVQRTTAALTAESAEYPSQKLTIGDTTVTKRKIAGSLNLTEEIVDWTDPAMLGLVLQDFSDMYVEISEDFACDFLENLPTYTTSYTGSTVQTIITSYMQAIQDVYSRAKRLPDTVWLPLDDHITLCSKLGTYEQSAIVLLNSALREAGFSVTFVVAPLLNTPVVGCRSLVESYEQQRGLLQVLKASDGSLDLGYRGYVATYGKTEGFVYLGATQGS